MKKLIVVILTFSCITLYSQVDNDSLLKIFIGDVSSLPNTFAIFKEKKELYEVCDTIFIVDSLNYFKTKTLRNKYNRLIVISENYLEKIKANVRRRDYCCYNFFITNIERERKKIRIYFSYPIINYFGFFEYKIKTRNIKLKKSVIYMVD